MSSNHPTARKRLALIATFLVPLGLATKYYSGPASAWVLSHVGGFLYVVFWCLLALVIWPRLSVGLVAWSVLLITSALEVLQLWHPPFLEAIRSNFLGQALLGAYFSWSDFPYYAAGAVTAVVLAHVVGGREQVSPLPPGYSGRGPGEQR